MKLAKVDHCATCPLHTEGEGRCSAEGATTADVYILGSAAGEYMLHNNFTAFSGESGRFFTSMLTPVLTSNPAFLRLRIRKQHATQCFRTNGEATAEDIKHCSALIRHDIYNSKAKVIIAMGADAMKSLNIHGTVGEMRGQTTMIRIGDRDIPIVVTLSPGALLQKQNTGRIPTFKADLAIGLRTALLGSSSRRTLPELTSKHQYCYTPQQFKELVDQVLSHPADLPSGEQGPPEKNMLAIDTETAIEGGKHSAINTWIPGFKIIALSVAWAPGEAAAVLLDHKMNPYPYADYKDDIDRLLRSANPKTFHNVKYEIKTLELALGYTINNVMFDSQMGEFLLDENKAGEYGLKKITKQRFPEYYGYEEMLRSSNSHLAVIDERKKSIEELRVASLKLKTEIEALKVEVRRLTALKQSTAKTSENYAKVLADLAEAKENKNAAQTYLEGIKNAMATLKADIGAQEAALEEKGESFEEIPVPTMLMYAAIDADITRVCSKQQIAEMRQQPCLFSALSRVMLPAARVLAEMEHVGIKVDMDYLQELKEHFDATIVRLRDEIYDLVGYEFNLNSGKATVDVLVDTFGIKLTATTRKGAIATDRAVLESLSKQHPIAKMMLEYKKAYKARHTFLEGIENGGKKKHSVGCSVDGRIHGDYNQTVTATGRLSSSNPNMQNIPKYILGKNIKKLFTVDDPDTEVMVQVDYSAAEVRVLTAYAPDPELIKILNSGKDMHSFVASKVFGSRGINGTPGVTYEQVLTREVHKNTNKDEYTRLNTMRQIAKMVMFLTIYGGTSETLKGNLENTAGIDIPQAECDAIMSSLLTQFPAIGKYMSFIKQQVSSKGEVTTYFGRKRRFHAAKFNKKLLSSSNREAINAPIQGTSSDIVLHQMTELWAHMNSLGYKRVFRGTVHDSMFFVFPNSKLNTLLPMLTEYVRDRVVTNFAWMPVKFEFDAEFGPNYGEDIYNLKKIAFAEDGSAILPTSA